MEKLLEDNLLRHYYIINYLIFKDWLPINHVATQAQLSQRTIQKDIGEMNAYLAPARIETSIKRGIRLVLPHNLNSFFLYSTIIKQSANFLILEEIFMHQHEKLNDLAEKLFISESTLKRKIIKINTVLADENFQIDTQHMDLVGDETKITWFFFCYLIEKYSILDGVLAETDITLIDDLLSEFLDFFPVLNTSQRKNFSYRNHMRIMLFINLKRMQKGHYFSSPATSQALFADFHLSYLLKQKIQARYSLDLTGDATYHLYYPFFNPLYAWDNADLAQKARDNLCIAKIVTSLDACLSEIEDTITITTPNKAYVHLSLYNLLVNNWGSPKILFQSGEEFF